DAASASLLRAIQDHFDSTLDGVRVLILCGKGNNGGDGAGLAQLLAEAGAECSVVLLGLLSETRGDASTNFERVTQSADSELLNFIECDDTSSWEQLPELDQEFDVIVDALFGTGLTRPVDGIYRKAIEHLLSLRETRDRTGAERPWILSVDIPSGLNADLTEPIGPAVKADLTVTFTAPKLANVLPPAC